MIIILCYVSDLFYPGCRQQEFPEVPPADREESQDRRRRG